MTLDDMLLRAHPGDGVVARFPGVILVVSPESARQEAATDQLLSLAEAAGMNGPTPGRRLARQVAGVLAGDPDDVPPFGLLAQGDTGLVMILQGAMDAEVSGPDGSEHLSGSQVATWVDRILPDTTHTVVVTPHGRPVAEPSPRSRLVAGVVAGGGASLRAAGPDAGASESAGAAPGAPLPGAGGPMGAEAPMAASGVPMATEAAASPALTGIPETPMTPDVPVVAGEVPPAMVPPYEPSAASPASAEAMASPEPEAAAAEAPMVAEELVGEEPSIGAAPPSAAAGEEPSAEGAPPGPAVDEAAMAPAPEAEAAAEAAAPLAAAEGEAAEPPPAPPEPVGADGEAPTPDASLEAVSRPAPGHAAPPTPLSRPLQDALEGPGATALAEPEGGTEEAIAAESPATPAEEQGPRVRGAMCPNGHFNDPAAPFCAVCGISMANRTLNLVEGPRPPLGVLTFDGGGTCLLDSDYVVGREPENDPTVTSGGAAPLILEDPDRTVSRVHARFVIDGWTVRVIDAGSANGTFIAPPAEESWIPLTPNTPTAITPGTRIRLGQRVVLFDTYQRTA